MLWPTLTGIVVISTALRRTMVLAIRLKPNRREKVQLILGLEKCCSEGMYHAVSPALVVKSAFLIEEGEKGLVLRGAEEGERADLRVGPEGAGVILFTLIGDEVHGVRLGNMLRVGLHEVCGGGVR
jgi:hypothetical protein